MIIDEKGRLFGLINLLDLVLLIGAVILVYLGVTVYLIYRQPVLAMEEINPKQMMVGESPRVTLTLVNERRLGLARVRLIPKDFQGEVVQLNGEIEKRVRDLVVFTVPPALQPGQYQVELEVVTLDLFNRQAIYVTRAKEQIFAVTAEPAPAPPPKVEDRGKYFWPMELEVFFPPGQKAATAGLRPGTEVVDAAGGFSAGILSVRPSGSRDTLSLTGKPWWNNAIPYRGGRVAWMRVEVDFVDLPAFQQKVLSPGAQLALRHQDQALTGYLLGMTAVDPQLPDNLVRWEVNVTMLSLNDAQRSVLGPNVFQVDPDNGLVLAQVVRLVKRQEDLWWRVVPPTDPNKLAPKSSPMNMEVRMKLLCELKSGRVYYRGVPLQPKALLTFTLNGQRMVGSVTGVREELIPVEFNVLLPKVPRQVTEQLKKALPVFNPATMEPLGTIKQVMAVEPMELPYGFKARDRISLGRDYKRCLVRMEIFCSLNNDGLISSNQKIDYGMPLKVVLLTEELEGVITSQDSLRPTVQPGWQEIEVVFRDLSPTVAALVREGETDRIDNEPVSMVIERIISNKPAQFLVTHDNVSINVGRHPLKRDIGCRLKIMAYRDGRKLFYKGRQLFLGERIIFRTDHWMANVELIDFNP